MAKILRFKSLQQRLQQRLHEELDHLHAAGREADDDITDIVNDPSLTPAHRRWLLENLLMDLDDQLVQYRRELELAERKLERTVASSERLIEEAYQEYVERVGELTDGVKNLTRRKRRREG